MQRLIVILLILIASVWAGSDMASHPGYLLLSYRQWVVELPLWLGFLSLLIVFFSLHFLSSLLGTLCHLDEGLSQWLRHRRHHKAHDKTHQGLLAMIEEQWPKAEGYLLAGTPQTKDSIVHYLLAAEAAFAQKAYDRCEKYLHKAYQAAPRARVSIGLVEAKLQLEQGQLEKALATLTSLRKLVPYHPAVLKHLEKIYIRLSAWQDLLVLLPALQKAKVITASQAQTFEKNLYGELLDEGFRKALSIHAVRELWHGMPKKIRIHPDILERSGRLLKGDKDSAKELEPLIRKCLEREWQADLIKLYGELLTGEPVKQLSVAETWLKQHGNSAPLFLTLGRLCLRCQLWGKARSYLEEGLRQEKSSEIQFELAKLFEHLGETQLALQQYKNGLAMAIDQ